METTISEQEYVKMLEEQVRQLEKAMTIIAETSGDFTQNIVNDALYEVGYYYEDLEDWFPKLNIFEKLYKEYLKDNLYKKLYKIFFNKSLYNYISAKLVKY